MVCNKSFLQVVPGHSSVQNTVTTLPPPSTHLEQQAGQGLAVNAFWLWSTGVKKYQQEF